MAAGEDARPSHEERLAQYANPDRPPACSDHSGTCPQNSALQVCDRCRRRHADLDFGQALACIMDVPLSEGREMQRRIIDRIDSGHFGGTEGSA